MGNTFKEDCKDKCRRIFAETNKNPYEWFKDNILEITESGKYVTVLTGYGGPTEWWTFNTETQSGRYYFHHGEVSCHRDFGKKTYQLLMSLI